MLLIDVLISVSKLDPKFLEEKASSNTKLLFPSIGEIFYMLWKRNRIIELKLVLSLFIMRLCKDLAPNLLKLTVSFFITRNLANSFQCLCSMRANTDLCSDFLMLIYDEIISVVSFYETENAIPIPFFNIFEKTTI